jgi:hypothetical protein
MIRPDPSSVTSTRSVRIPSSASAFIFSRRRAAAYTVKRNVSVERVRAFKILAIEEVGAIAATLSTVTPLRLVQATSVVTTATSMAGALWQMAAPRTKLRAFYESDPELSHAIVDVEPRLADVLSALIAGYLTRAAKR